MKLLGLLLLAAFSLNANAAKKAPCSAQDAIITAAEEAVPGDANDISSDPAEFEKTSKGHDEFTVAVTYNDICHRIMTVYMKAGTCTVSKKVKAGNEICTDN